MHRTSSANIMHGRGDPVDKNEGQPSESDDEALCQQSDDEDESNDVGGLSESEKDGQESVADGCAKRGTSGEDLSTTADDQDAGASRAVDSVYFGLIVKIWILDSFQINL